MKIIAYIKHQKEIIIAVLSMFTVTNLILLLSTPLDKSLGEIFYMDLLMIFLLATGFIINYLKVSKSYEDIQQLILEKEDIEESYRQKMNNLRDYITQIIHDIKVNLAVCEMVISRFEDDYKLKKLIFQVEQMKFKSNEILYITRANHYSEDIISEHIEIEKVVRAAIKENAEFLMSKGISVEMELLPYEFVSDKKWVHYIITQIINNSSKYTSQNGKLDIWGEEDALGYHLNIKDNGIGISEDEISRVFDKGFTGTNGRQNTKSTGMGMYYAKKMAQVLGIGLEVKSDKGMYTNFKISFYKVSDYINMTQMSH